MATFDANGRANGTTLVSLDALWTGIGATDHVVDTNDWVNVQPWANGPSMYPNAQGNNQLSRLTLAAGTPSPTGSWLVYIHDDGTDTAGYTLQVGETAWEVRRAGAFETIGSHGLSWPLASSTTLEISKAASVITAKLGGTTLYSWTDGTPVTAGSPGFQLLANGTAGGVRARSWTDGVTGGGGGGGGGAAVGGFWF